MGERIRKIIHVDMDAYVLEQRDNPELRAGRWRWDTGLAAAWSRRPAMRRARSGSTPGASLW